MVTVHCIECGKPREVQEATAYYIRRGKIKGYCPSCASLAKRNRNYRHGQSNSYTYTSWCHMRQRTNPRTPERFPRHSGRGIACCERWQSFANFLADMGERPEGLTLERIDNDGNYEPSNCKWATRREQRLNQRPRQVLR
jgi:hypothetical protein